MYTPRFNRSYFTGSQCQIHIDTVLVDEAIEIEGTYDLPMYPIYGYKSQHFDTVAQGHVIAMGTLTINYVFDGYLYALLKKSKNPMGTPESIPVTNNNNELILSKDIVISDVKPSDDYNKELRWYEVEDQLFGNTNEEIDALRKELWARPDSFGNKLKPEFTVGPVKIVIKDFKLGYDKPRDTATIKESYEEKVLFDVFFTKYSTLRNSSAAPVAESYQFISRTLI